MGQRILQYEVVSTLRPNSVYLANSGSEKVIVKRQPSLESEEAKILANNKHPGLLRLIDLFSDHKNRAYAAMEYLDAPTLQVFYDEDIMLSEEQALGMAADVSNTLRYLHEEKRVVHNDTAMGNIVLTSPVTKLIDLESALPMRVRSAEHVRSTPGFRPVEQILGRNTTASDIFGLSACTYVALTGQLPYLPMNQVRAFAKYHQNGGTRSFQEFELELLLKGEVPDLPIRDARAKAVLQRGLTPYGPKPTASEIAHTLSKYSSLQ